MLCLWLFSVQNCKSIPISKWEYRKVSTCIYLGINISPESLTSSNWHLFRLAQAKRKKEKGIQATLRGQERHQEF